MTDDVIRAIRVTPDPWSPRIIPEWVRELARQDRIDVTVHPVVGFMIALPADDGMEPVVVTPGEWLVQMHTGEVFSMKNEVLEDIVGEKIDRHTVHYEKRLV